jgi:hypothetical protein
MENRGAAYRVFEGTPGGTRQLSRPRRTGVDNINTDLPTEWDSMVWTEWLWTETSGGLL